MLKKNILFIILILSFLGCSIPPFNTKADLDYNLTDVNSTYSDVKEDEIKNNEFFIEIPIENKNSVGAKVIEVKAEVNGTSAPVKVLEGSNEWDIKGNSVTRIKINPFKTADNEDLSVRLENTVKINEIKIMDQNKNDIKLGEIYKNININRTVVNEAGESQNKIPESPNSLSYEIDFDAENNPTVILKWDNVEEEEKDVLGYKIYREETTTGITEGNEQDLTPSGSTVTTPFTQYEDVNIQKGKKYIYYVTTIDTQNQESSKNIKSQKLVIIKEPGNYSTSNFEIFPVDESVAIKLEWEPPTDQGTDTKASLEGYKIFRKTSGTEYKIIKDEKNPKAEDYTDNENLSEKETYTYKLIFYDELGQEGESSSKTITVPDITPPNAPSGLELTLNPSYELDVTWTQNSDEDLKEYVVEYKTGSTDWTALEPISGITSTKIQIKDMIGETIYVRLKALDESGNGDNNYGAMKSMLLDYTQNIEAPTDININGGKLSVNMNWNEVEGQEGYDITGYRVKYGTDPMNLEYTANPTSNNININQNTTPGAIDKPGIWFLKIAALEKGDGSDNGEIEGKYSRLKKVIVYDDLPKLLGNNDISRDLSPTGNLVKWKSIYDDKATGYVIYRAVNDGSEPDESEFTYLTSKKVDEFEIQPDDDGGEWKLYQDTSANQVGKTYWYKVALYNGEYTTSNPKTGPFSMPVDVIDYGSPKPVDYNNDLKVEAREPYGKIRVSWSNYQFDTNDIAGFKVYVSRVGDGNYYFAGKTSQAYLDLDVSRSGDFDTITCKYPIEREDASWENIGKPKNTLSTGSSINISDISNADKINKEDYLKILGRFYKVKEKDTNTITVTPDLVDEVNTDKNIYVYDHNAGPGTETKEVNLKDSLGERMFYIKVSAYNKAGRESETTAYKWVDMTPPDNPIVQVSSYDDDGTQTAKVEWGVTKDAAKYEVYKYVSATTGAAIVTSNLDDWGIPNGILLGETTGYKMEDPSFDDLTEGSAYYAVVSVDAYGNKSPLYTWDDENYEITNATTSAIVKNSSDGVDR